MPTPDFVSLPPLRLKELETGSVLRIAMNISGSDILGLFTYDRGDDIEISAVPDDWRQIKALLERELHLSADTMRALDEPMHSVLSHKFKNLDGGVDAAFLITRNGDAIDITVERSDEGAMGFRVSLEDSKRLLDFIDSALQFTRSLPHT